MVCMVGIDVNIKGDMMEYPCRECIVKSTCKNLCTKLDLVISVQQSTILNNSICIDCKSHLEQNFYNTQFKCGNCGHLFTKSGLSWDRHHMQYTYLRYMMTPVMNPHIKIITVT